MIVDHSDIAQIAFDQADLPDPPRAVEDSLHYVTLLLSMLPEGEHAGYVGKPAGENIAPNPDGIMVSVGRVCYPDGQIYKVMNDVPNGTSQWVDNGLIPDGQTYVSYNGTHTDPGTPPTDGGDALDLEPRVAALENRVAALEAWQLAMNDGHGGGWMNEVVKQLTSINEWIANHG